MAKIYENFEFNSYEYISEAEASTSDLGTLPNGVLGIVRGPSFFLDGFSRNGRFYPKELWENAIQDPDFQRKLNRGLIFGCIGHPENYTLDDLLASGKVSHKIVSININEKEKVGEAVYHILDTPAGRILNTILKSGSKLYVSTRGFGSFTEEFVEKDGKKYKKINPKDFKLESIDFVIEPGFLETNPEIVENLKEDFKLLKESKDGIVCVDGICGLNLNEEKEEEKDAIVEEFQNLTEKEQIELIKKLVEENKTLRTKLDEMSDNEFADLINKNMNNENPEEKSDNTNDHDDKYAKLTNNDIKIISYLETISKAIKTLKEYKELYEKIMTVLENEKPIESLKDDFEALINSEETEESLKTIVEKILKLMGISVDKNEDLIEKLVEVAKENEELKFKIQKFEHEIKEKLTSALYSLAEELIDSQTTVESLKEEKNMIQNELEETLKVIDTIKTENEKLQEKVKETTETLNSLQEKFEEKLEQTLAEKEAEIIATLKEQQNKEIEEMKVKYESQLKDLKEKLARSDKSIVKLTENLTDYKIKYFKSLCPTISENVIKENIEKHKDDNKILENLKMLEKHSVFTTNIVEKEVEIEETSYKQNKTLAEKLIG